MRFLLRMMLCAPLVMLGGLCSAGCITAGTWGRAFARTVEFPHAIGSLEGPDGRPQALVVAYHVDVADHRSLTVAIPLDAKGRPVEPFVYRGSGTNGKDVRLWIEADETHRRAGGVVFGADAMKSAERAVRSPRFRKANCGPGTMAVADYFHFDKTPEVTAIAYWPATEADARWCYLMIPSDANVIVLPAEQPRPAGDRAGNLLFAAAVTPFTLVVDAVVTPAYFLLVISGVRC